MERDTYVIHVNRPGQVGLVLADSQSRAMKKDEMVLTLWETEQGQEVCWSEAILLQEFRWGTCLECERDGQIEPGYWKCIGCAEMTDDDDRIYPCVLYSDPRKKSEEGP